MNSNEHLTRTLVRQLLTKALEIDIIEYQGLKSRWKFGMEEGMKKTIKYAIRICFLFLLLGMLFPAAADAKKSNAKKKENPYQIKINKLQNTVTIYKKKKPIKAFACSTGNATPIGTFSIQQRMYIGVAFIFWLLGRMLR